MIFILRAKILIQCVHVQYYSSAARTINWAVSRPTRRQKMAEVTREMILDYMQAKGGVVKNVDLVRHFRKYLQVSDPRAKGVYTLIVYIASYDFQG